MSWAMRNDGRGSDASLSAVEEYSGVNYIPGNWITAWAYISYLSPLKPYELMEKDAGWSRNRGNAHLPSAASHGLLGEALLEVPWKPPVVLLGLM